MHNSSIFSRLDRWERLAEVRDSVELAKSLLQLFKGSTPDMAEIT